MIRPYVPTDLPAVLDLLEATFAPFFAESMPAYVGVEVTALQHPDWRGDYARDVPGMHDPGAGKYAVVAVEDERVVGYLSWDHQPDQRKGQLQLLAVHPDARRGGVARTLCEHGIAHLREAGVALITIGTGGDGFHAPARALYESLGFRGLPTMFYARTY